MKSERYRQNLALHRADQRHDVREVSSYLHVHPSTIYRLLRQNQIPAFRIGGDSRFNVEAIDHWRLRQEKTSN